MIFYPPLKVINFNFLKMSNKPSKWVLNILNTLYLNHPEKIGTFFSNLNLQIDEAPHLFLISDEAPHLALKDTFIELLCSRV